MKKEIIFFITAFNTGKTIKYDILSGKIDYEMYNFWHCIDLWDGIVNVTEEIEKNEGIQPKFIINRR